MTMKTPEMEVVRFKEADVIVASGDPVVDSNYYASFSNLGPAAFEKCIEVRICVI